ncbi:hypothetical protein K8R66_01175 [bacterium]|nr:hypothetical protein [bacterium]
MKSLLLKIKNLGAQLNKKRKIFFVSIFALLSASIFYPFFVTAGGVKDAIAEFISGLLTLGISFVGWLVSMEVGILVFFARWDHFITVPAVDSGWIIMRDLCNMFFIMVLLVVAFATILGIESYSYKKWLGKIIIFAVLINFSKTITGLLIDFSQVIMLSFVSSFKDATEGNLASGLHLNKFLSTNLSDKEGGAYGLADSTRTATGLLLALTLLVIFSIVVFIMIVVILGRIVTLWVLIILSPMAYLLQTVPFGQKYASQWWSELGKNLTAGPVIAFFLWLALYTIQDSGESVVERMENVKKENEKAASKPKGDDKEATVEDDPSTPLSKMASLDYLLDYVVVIALLIAAIQVTEKMGVAGSKLAGSMHQKISSAGTAIAKAPFKGLGALASYADRETLGKVGLGYNATKMGIKNLKDSFAERKKSSLNEITKAASRNLKKGGVMGVVGGGAAGTEYGKRYTAGFLGLKGVGRAWGDTFYPAKKKEDERKLSESVEMSKKINGYMDDMGNGFKDDDEKDEAVGRAKKERDEFAKGVDGLKVDDLTGDKRAAFEKEKETLQGEIANGRKGLKNLTGSDKKFSEEALEKKEKKLFNMTKLDELNNDFNEVKGREIFSKDALKKKIEGEDGDKTKELDAIEKDETLNKKQKKKRKEEIEDKYEGALDAINGIKDKETLEKEKAVEMKRIDSSGLSDSEKDEQREEAKKYYTVGENKKQAVEEMKGALGKEKEVERFFGNRIGKHTVISTSGRAVEKSMIGDKKKELAGVDNHDELRAMLRSSLNSKDKYMSKAIIEKLTEDGNLNEALNEHGYDSNAVGLHQFFSEFLSDKLNMGEQETLSTQNDISYLAEKAGHWEMARTVSMTPSGEFKSLITQRADGSWDDSGHAKECYGDIMKKDPQHIARNLNRLAYGGETGDGKREFKLSSLGRMLVSSLSGNQNFMSNMGRLNQNAAQNFMYVEGELENLTNAGFINNVRGIAATKDGRIRDPESEYKKIREYEIERKKIKETNIEKTTTVEKEEINSPDQKGTNKKAESPLKIKINNKNYRKGDVINIKTEKEGEVGRTKIVSIPNEKEIEITIKGVRKIIKTKNIKK